MTVNNIEWLEAMLRIRDGSQGSHGIASLAFFYGTGKHERTYVVYGFKYDQINFTLLSLKLKMQKDTTVFVLFRGYENLKLHTTKFNANPPSAI